jgi:hypothetical protein
MWLPARRSTGRRRRPVNFSNTPPFTNDSLVSTSEAPYHGLMESALWILLPGFVAIGSGVLSWFVMQSRMEVAIAKEREALAEARGAVETTRATMEDSMQTAVKLAEESARREALEEFLGDLHIEQRHYTRENKLLLQNRRSLILQERMYFRNLPLSDWIEHEVLLDEGADPGQLAQNMTVFDKGVLSISEIPRRKALA